MPQFKLRNELARLTGHNVLGRPRMSPRNVIVYRFQKRRNVWRRPVVDMKPVASGGTVLQKPSRFAAMTNAATVILAAIIYSEYHAGPIEQRMPAEGENVCKAVTNHRGY
ncbi:MAG TPA: hypothetical protein VGV87_24100 [Blastocatellia bacterium]|nr:hypothetical protein [Blastocatellia bacterium]